ncbi:MAG: hypothetical protein MJ116_10520 [Lachnospiraceae bacterium]|nr:hypothetical protein [Lachnospiraceae bacterium]
MSESILGGSVLSIKVGQFYLTINSFVALAILLYFIGLPLIMAALLEHFGSVGEIITNMIDLIPFGKTYYEFAVQIVNSLSGQVVNYNHFDDYLTIGYIIGELAKGLFTVIMFEALNLGCSIFLGLVDPKSAKIDPRGIWNKAKYVLITAINALLAACLSPLPMNYIFSIMHSLGSVGSGIVSFLLSVVLVGGGVAFFVFLNSLSVGKAIAYVLIKFFLIGACRTSVSYLAILAILLGWQNGLYRLLASGVTLFFTIALLLGGIEMAIKNVFG